MLSPSEFIESVLSHQNYDPVRAHEYYLRTRDLKGRGPVKLPPPVTRKSGVTKPTAIRHPAIVKPKPTKKVVKTAEQRRKEIEAQVSALKTRLETLRNILSELVKQAQARSGATPADSKKTASNSKLTSAQKKAASDAAKKYYEKHKNDKQSPSEQLKTLQIQVKNMETKIAEMRKKLADSKRVAAPKTGSVGVRNLKR